MKQQHDIGYARIAHHVRLYTSTLFIVSQLAASVAIYFISKAVTEHKINFTAPTLTLMLIGLIVFETLIGLYSLIIVALPFKFICQILSRKSELEGLGGWTTFCVKICPFYIKSELAKLNTLLSGDIRRRNNERQGLVSLSDAMLKDDILSIVPVGIIILNSNLDIVYNNGSAPIALVNGSPTIQLDFSNDTLNLQDWILKMQAEQIYGQRVWSHIANVSPDSIEERHIYDVVVQYQRDSIEGMDIAIITVDRTDKYVAEESTMDTLTLAAHELRGPITTMRGYIDILKDNLSSSDADNRKLLDLVDVSSQRLSSYINNILNASRYDHRGLKFRPQKITIYDILSDIKDDLALRASTTQRKLTWQIENNLPSIFADRSSIGEVISNLVDNAIKYTKENGSIHVTAKVDEEFLTVSVHDNGIGITSTAMQNLFSKFYRSGRSKQAIGGSGLGLYISRAIIKQHSGFIAAESVEGKGTTFTIWLPLYKPGQEETGIQTELEQPLSLKGMALLRNHNKIIQ